MVFQDPRAPVSSLPSIKHHLFSAPGATIRPVEMSSNMPMVSSLSAYSTISNENVAGERNKVYATPKAALYYAQQLSRHGGFEGGTSTRQDSLRTHRQKLRKTRHEKKKESEKEKTNEVMSEDPRTRHMVDKNRAMKQLLTMSKGNGIKVTVLNHNQSKTSDTDGRRKRKNK